MHFAFQPSSPSRCKTPSSAFPRCYCKTFLERPLGDPCSLIPGMDRREQQLALLLFRCVEEGHTKGAEAALAAGASVDGLPLPIACPLTHTVLLPSQHCQPASRERSQCRCRCSERRLDFCVKADDGVVALAEGCRPLHVAAERRDRHTIGLLLQSGATVNATDAYGSTPLSALCRFCAIESS